MAGVARSVSPSSSSGSSRIDRTLARMTQAQQIFGELRSSQGKKRVVDHGIKIQRAL